MLAKYVRGRTRPLSDSLEFMLTTSVHGKVWNTDAYSAATGSLIFICEPHSNKLAVKYYGNGGREIACKGDIFLL